jgi:hypothetical protein
MSKKTIFKMQVQQFYSGSAIRIIEDTCKLLDHKTDRWLPFETMSVNAWKERIAEKMDKLNAETSTEDVWRECWLASSGDARVYRQGKDGQIDVGYVDSPGVNSYTSEVFDKMFNLYPPLDDEKVHVWEFNGTKIAFALLYDLVAWHNSVIESGDLQELLDRTANLLIPLTFENFYAELQEIKHNQTQSVNYEVVWTEEKPPMGAYSQVTEWLDGLGLSGKIWTCEVVKK